VRLLLDTHILVWALIAPNRLPPEARAKLESGDNDVLFSAASMWEMAIKAALGRADFQVSPDAMFKAAVDSGFRELAVKSQVALLAASLPMHHRDPFDRMLVAQAMTESAMFYTFDPKLAVYSDLVVCV
jgi:PIN domain nuclease of toxin-antitoxin system